MRLDAERTVWLKQFLWLSNELLSGNLQLTALSSQARFRSINPGQFVIVHHEKVS